VQVEVVVHDIHQAMVVEDVIYEKVVQIIMVEIDD
jgi:hypothetical protein